ncbi:helix-turn-helix domain-containing protein [Enterococcus sp. AZ126]|uniref:helix-turn-helix domain-containing protein n=1 Tax=Enterococcus sp. AZ126 TaxID=2774635 RepID=UPI003F2028A4
MNYIKSIRRKNKMSREELSQKLNIPVKLLSKYERATNPVLTLQLKERFKSIFELSEEELNYEIKATEHAQTSN